MTDMANDRPSAATVLAAMQRLIAVLTRENAALAEQSDASVRALAREKQEACLAYERLLRRPGALAWRIGDGERSYEPALRKASAILSAACTENDRRLRAAIAARTYLLNAISTATSALKPGPGTYGRTGAKRECVRGAREAMPAISFNQSL